MSAAGLFVFGAVVGLLSGLFGIGGGIVLVPGLVILFGFTQSEAQGTSLAVLSFPVVIFAALIYYQNGFVRVPVVAAIIAGFVVGAYAGARLVPVVPAATLRLGFGGLLLYLGAIFVFDIRPTRSAAALPAGIAAIVMAVFGRFMRRRWRRKSPEPPGSVEYHI